MTAHAAAAQEVDAASETETEVIVVESPAGESGLNASAFRSVVSLDQRAVETLTLAELLAEGVGVRIRSLGGLGAFSSISVRGTSSGATTLLVDGIPLSRLSAVTANLGRIDLGSFSQVEIYRGGAPASFGVATLGGAVNLVTRLLPPEGDPIVTAGLGLGSFGARHARASYLGAAWGRGVTVAASYQGAEGDYTYYSDNGTNLNLDDDGDRERQNNGFDHGELVLRMGVPDKHALGARVVYRRQGVPGIGSVQTREAALETFSVMGDGEGNLQLGPRSKVSLGGFTLLERSRYRDPLDEVGLGAQNRRYVTLASGLTATIAAALGDHSLAAGLGLRLDIFDDHDFDSAGPSTPRGSRPAASITLTDEIALASGRVRLAPGLRFDIQHTRPVVDRNAALGSDAVPRTDLFPSPRLGALVRLGASVALKGNAGLYFRAPTLIELFGDRGYLVGNPDLDPERGVAADLGIVSAFSRSRGVVDQLMVEAAAFITRARSVIAMSSNAGGFTGAVNVGTATTAGGEFSSLIRLGHIVTLSGGYTLLFTRRESDDPSADGNELPRRPRHQFFGRSEVVVPLPRPLTLWAELDWRGASFSDTANRDPLPRRLFVGAGLKVQLVDSVRVGAEVKNLFDERVEDVELDPPPSPELARIPRAVSDFFGYPLPGRAFYASMEMTL